MGSVTTSLRSPTMSIFHQFGDGTEASVEGVTRIRLNDSFTRGPVTDKQKVARVITLPKCLYGLNRPFLTVPICLL